MVKTKANKKPKQNKNSHIKKNGNQADISEFRAQLDVLGLKIIQVTADGNCFFRALADQLEGNEDEHVKYRKMVVEFIKKNREMFEPFIEDDMPFDEYCQSMGHDGTWAGHMELQAASLVTHSNICIHRKMSPRWYIRNFDDHGTQMIHLSYHDWEHYNSVRLKEDTCIGPTRPIIIKADADLSVKSHQAKAAITKANGGTTKTIIQAESIKKVMIGTGCEDEEKIEEVLLQFGGNVNTAIELLIEEQGKEGFSDLNDRISCSADSSHGSLTDSHNEKSEQCNEKVLDNVSKYAQTCHNIGSVIDKTNLLNDEKKIPRNKGCPCGSKKKYKACCGTVAARSSVKFAVNQTVGYGKGQKDKKHGRRGGQSNVANSFGSDEGPLDMGALCI